MEDLKYTWNVFSWMKKIKFQINITTYIPYITWRHSNLVRYYRQESWTQIGGAYYGVSISTHQGPFLLTWINFSPSMDG